MSAPPPAAAFLAPLLGDPADPANPFGWPQALRRAASGEAPEAARAKLAEAGICEELIPAHWASGGRLTDLGRVFALARELAGRDPALIPPMAAKLGALALGELAGTPRLQAILAGVARSGGLALAFAEADPDLSRAQAQAETLSGRLRVSGRKGLTAGAHEALAFAVLVREPEGPSLLLAPREGQGGKLKLGPRRRLTGLSGLDLSEILFDSAEAPERIGPPGAGLSLARRALSLVKSFNLAALLGPLETALNLAARLEAAQPAERRAPERALLAEAMAAFHGLEAFAEMSIRAFGACPAQAGVWADALQARAQEAATPILAAAAGAIGARALLAEDPAGALFAKLRRDVEAARLLDPEGSGGLALLASHLGPLAASAGAVAPEARWARLRAGFATGLSGPPISPDLALRPAAGDALTEALPALILAAQDDPRLSAEPRATLIGALRKSAEDFAGLNHANGALLKAHGARHALSPEYHDVGAAFARHVALCGLAAWWLARETDPRPFYRSGEALALAAAQLAGSAAPQRGRLREGVWAMRRARAETARSAA